MKQGHNQRERETDRKTATETGGRREQAKERGTYAGGSDRTSVNERPAATTLDRQKMTA